MNKLIIPSILGISILFAGVFAFMPVEQANTLHETIRDEIANDISGATLTVTTTEFSTTFTGGDNATRDRFHYVILESADLFTIQEVEIEVDLGNATGENDRIDLRDVYMMGDQYGSTKAEIEAAEANDVNHLIEVCDTCSELILGGTGSLSIATWSWNGMLADEEDHINLSVGPGSKLIFELEMQDDNNQEPNNIMTATFIFYLSGPDEAIDMTIVELEDEVDPTTGAP